MNLDRTNTDYEEWLAEVVELVEWVREGASIRQEIEEDDRWFLESYFSYAAAHHAADDYMRRWNETKSSDTGE